MANFKEDDWVQITGTPDLKWGRWSNNPTYYNNFLNKIGQIKEIDEDVNRPGNFIYKIGVNFEHDINDGYSTLSPGKYYEWFRADHLIKSSKYEADRKVAQAKAAIDLQEWEKFKKKSTDDALRKVFCPEPTTEENKQDTISEDPYEPYDPWHLKTNPGDIPDYNSMQKDDEYEVNLLDFLNPNDPFFHSD
jgi:hypothetical protein